MKKFGEFKSAGLAAGLALIITAGLAVSAAADNSPPEAMLKTGPIDPAVIAPAEALGKAFNMVAEHVRPAVVSVYSEKNITLTQIGITGSVWR